MLYCPFLSPLRATSRNPGRSRSPSDVTASSTSSRTRADFSIAWRRLLNFRSSIRCASLSQQERIIRFSYYDIRTMPASRRSTRDSASWSGYGVLGSFQPALGGAWPLGKWLPVRAPYHTAEDLHLVHVFQIRIPVQAFFVKSQQR